MFFKTHSETDLVYNPIQSRNEMSQGVQSSQPELSILRRHDSVSRILIEGDLMAGKVVGLGTTGEAKPCRPFQLG